MERHHLRSDEEKKIKSKIKKKLDVEIEGKIEAAEIEGHTFYLVDGDPLLTHFNGEIFLTVKGALELNPEKKRVTVDSGAVEPISRGADVMKPGIVEADPSVKKKDLVIIREQEHGQPLAIGRVLSEDLKGEKGEAIKNIHHVQDEMWRLFDQI